MKKPPLAGLLCAVLAAASALAPQAHAATLTVTSANDSGPGSLRETVALAASGDEITFAPHLDGVALSLAAGQIVLDKDLTLIGRGSDKTLIQGNGISFPVSETPTRLFRIDPGVTVEMTHLSLSGGFVRSSMEPGGGAVLNFGTLIMTNSVVEQNTADGLSGAGIYNSGGSIFITDTQFRSNSVDNGGGGGICNDSNGVATITHSLFSGHIVYNGAGAGISNTGKMTIVSTVFYGGHAWAGGGAVANTGSVRIFDSLILANGTNSYGPGGGITNFGTLFVERSALLVNSSEVDGGGLANSGEAVIINSTLQNNEARGSGGGIRNLGGTLLLDHVTVAGNHANADDYYVSAGIDNGNGSSGVVKARNTIIVGNYSWDCVVTPEQSTCIADCIGNFISEGHNIVGQLDASYGDYDGTIAGPFTVCSGFSQHQGDLVDVAVHDVTEYTIEGADWGRPNEHPLVGDNGGTLPTVALLPHSLARDAVPLSDCTDFDGNPIASDQRGVPRPQGTTCDVGAFEFSEPHDTLFWSQQCREKTSAEYGPGTLEQLLAAVSEKSIAFPECAVASCAALEPDSPRSSWKDKAARELLGVWLNLASGRLTKGRPIELVELTSATTVGAAVAEVEAVICNPAATKQDLSHAKQVAQALNESSGR